MQYKRVWQDKSVVWHNNDNATIVGEQKNIFFVTL